MNRGSRGAGPPTERLERTSPPTIESKGLVPTQAAKLTLENHHRKSISVFLVNCLSNPKVVSQRRNQDQSFYELTLG
jgi:hypothetical protein